MENDKQIAESISVKDKPAKNKKIVVSIIVSVFLIALLLIGWKVYKVIEQRKIDETVYYVYTQLADSPFSSFVSTDSSGNVIAFQYFDIIEEESQVEYSITKFELNNETGKLCDPIDEDTDIMDMVEPILADNGYYYYDKKISEIRLDNGECIKVNIDKENRVRTLEYNGTIYKEADESTRELIDEFDNYLIRYNEANSNAAEYEARLRSAVFYCSGFDVPMDDLLDSFFKDYTVTVEPNREDEDSYYVYVSGPCYGYSFLYYIVTGYSNYLQTSDEVLTYEYSETNDEFTVISDFVNGYSLRELYAQAYVYSHY